MNLLELAAASGLQVTLDARIGMQEYKSVYGSLEALSRFADAVLGAISVSEDAQAGELVKRKETREN
jgi:hypothetical protein